MPQIYYWPDLQEGLVESAGVFKNRFISRIIRVSVMGCRQLPLVGGLKKFTKGDLKCS